MRRRRWTIQEMQMLMERYPDEGPNQLAQELGRSADSVSSFAHRCGLRTQRWLERLDRFTTFEQVGVACCQGLSS